VRIMPAGGSGHFGTNGNGDGLMGFAHR